MTSVETMSLPCASLLDAVTIAAATVEAELQLLSSDDGASSAELDAIALASVAATTYTTPRRSTGLATVTPGTIGGPPVPAEGDLQKEDSERQPLCLNTEGEGMTGKDESLLVPASSGTSNVSAKEEEVGASSVSSSKPPQRTVSMSSNSSSSLNVDAPTAVVPPPTPSVRLGPRVTPRKCTRTLCPPSTCVKGGDARGDSIAMDSSSSSSSSNLSEATPLKPRNLDGILKNGEGKHRAVSGQAHPSTPARLPPPISNFLADKISPLRSLARRNEKIKATVMKRELTPPPQFASTESAKSSGLWLSPRTPMPPALEYRAASAEFSLGGLTPSRMTPGVTPGLTPTNFACDFGKGHKKEGSMGAVDSNNVFAWLQSPGQGLFTPSGGLNSLSAMNTPRGMYGFSAIESAAGYGAHSPTRQPNQGDSSYAEVQLEAGGDIGVNTPKIPDCQRSMICISPLASRNRSGKKGPLGGAPDTPMSINFSEVFASPRMPTPRLRQTLLCSTDDGDSTSDGRQSSPVASALHSAERGVNLDDDLNALLQLAESTTPGGRLNSMAFMSPLLTNGLRLASDAARNRETPSSLQLPIIRGSSRGTPGMGTRASPPQLAIRSMSGSGSPPMKSLLKSKSNKRKTSDGEYHDQYQPPGYTHPSMLQYTQPGGSKTVHHGYYHNPGYGSHPGYVYPGQPQQHYYPQPPPVPASASSSPVKPSKGKSRSKTKSTTKKKAEHVAAIAQSDGVEASAPTPKRVRKSVQSSTEGSSSKKPQNGASDPADKQRIAEAVAAVNAVYGDGTEKQRKLMEATFRGVTQRPSKKWQAQLYYAGKSRYIGVFDSKEKASLAYEIAREILKADNESELMGRLEDIERNVGLARKAAFAGINDHCGKLSSY